MNDDGGDRECIGIDASGRRMPWVTAVIACGLNAGCAFDRHKEVEVISDPPGARIEVNGDFVGNAPTVITMLGEPDGEVEMDYIIRAYPSGPEYYPQAKVFVERASGDDDTIPKRVFFDMRVRQPSDELPADQSSKRRRSWP